MESGHSHIKGIIEALLFVSEKPVVLEQIKEAIEGIDTRDIRDLINQLQTEYKERNSGIHIVEIAGGYQMLTNSAYVMYIKKFYHSRHKEKLSKPALETLAIIAYKQPVTRLEVELIRGVNSDSVVVHLMDKGLIKISGRKDIPGRPYLYSTSKQFLEYFGLKTLVDLPRLEDFSSLQPSEDKSEQAEGNEGEPKPEQETVQAQSQQEQPQESVSQENVENPQ